jgi:hypothetical protein
MEGLRKHMDEQPPRWKKIGIKILTEEESDALRNGEFTDEPS